MEDPTHLSLCFSLPPLESNSVMGRGRTERMEGRKKGRQGRTDRFRGREREGQEEKTFD